MKECLNIQQYKEELHRPNSHRGPKPNRSTCKYFSRRGRKENPIGRRSKRLVAIPFLQLQDKHRYAIYREKQGLYKHHTSSGISLPLSFHLSWGLMCGEFHWPSEARLLPVLKSGHATQLWCFIYLYRDLPTSIVIPHQNLPVLRLNFYQSGHKFTHALNREWHSFLMT